MAHMIENVGASSIEGEDKSMRKKLQIIAFAVSSLLNLPVSCTNSGFRFPER
jgi:hypothetical protein